MIHINSKNSMMFNRRHRGWIQTTIILILIVALGYGVYLYNLLQGKMQHMDIKSQRFQSQHQSLSSQLQVVYEDRSKLEGFLQKEKTDHQSTKDELEQHLQSHQVALEKLDKEHQLKFEELNSKHLNSQEQLKDANKRIDEIKAKNKNSAQQYEEQLNQLQQQLQEKSGLQSNVNDLQSKFTQLQNEHDKLQQNHNQLKVDHVVNQKEVGKYLKLHSLLSGLGADILKLDHPNLGKLRPDDRAMVFAHFGGDPKNAQLMENNREKLLQQQESRSMLLEKQRLEKQQRDNMLAARNNAQQQNEMQPLDPEKKQAPQENNICLLPKEVGTCTASMHRYYYDTQVNRCLVFIFTGCGGNNNNFASYRECEEKCHGVSDPQSVSTEKSHLPDHPVDNHQLNDQQEDADPHEQADHNKNNEDPVRAQEYHKDQDQPENNESQDIQDVGAEHETDIEREDKEKAPSEENNDQVEDVDSIQQENNLSEDRVDHGENGGEKSEELKQIEMEERKAKEAEQLARQELDQQNDQKDENNDKSESKGNPIEMLKELQEQNKQILNVQAAQIEELVKQKQADLHKGQVHGQIFEEEAKNLGMVNNKQQQSDNDEDAEQYDEDNAQVDVPPAERPHKEDPQFVGHAPVGNENDHNRGEEDEQGYNGENDNGEEEDDEYAEENDDNNGYGDSKEDDFESDPDSRHQQALAQPDKKEARRREM